VLLDADLPFCPIRSRNARISLLVSILSSLASSRMRTFSIHPPYFRSSAAHQARLPPPRIRLPARFGPSRDPEKRFLPPCASALNARPLREAAVTVWLHCPLPPGRVLPRAESHRLPGPAAQRRVADAAPPKVRAPAQRARRPGEPRPSPTGPPSWGRRAPPRASGRPRPALPLGPRWGPPRASEPTSGSAPFSPS